MPHSVILGEAMETLTEKQSAPPTEAQANLMKAFTAADDYGHTGDPEIFADIEQYVDVIVQPYLDTANPISDTRLPTYTNAILAMIP